MKMNTRNINDSDDEHMSNMSPGLKHLSRDDSLSPSPFGKNKLTNAVG